MASLPLSMKLIRKKSLIKEVLSDLWLPILWDVGAGLGKESATHADFLLNFILPLFYKILDIRCGRLANSQGPFLLLAPSMYIRFLWYLWHHYCIWALVLNKDQAWGVASYRWELATKRERSKDKNNLKFMFRIWVSLLWLLPKILVMLFFCGISYWYKLFTICLCIFSRLPTVGVCSIKML